MGLLGNASQATSLMGLRSEAIAIWKRHVHRLQMRNLSLLARPFRLGGTSLRLVPKYSLRINRWLRMTR